MDLGCDNGAFVNAEHIAQVTTVPVLSSLENHRQLKGSFYIEQTHHGGPNQSTEYLNVGTMFRIGI